MTSFTVPPSPSALNLELHGSTGRFQISQGSTKSLEVRYFLTNVGLDLAHGTNGVLLDHLAPVREVFDFSALAFDELMQRDIDDARVTSELIPYLLDTHSQGLVKLFPPIVVMLLPVELGTTKPARLYPAVSIDETPQDDQGRQKLIIQSGSTGGETFRIEQFRVNGILNDHDIVRLHVNTLAARFVIVDGQHRAMALLALFRNIVGQWSDERRRPYQEYYEEWSPDILLGFNLENIQLPVMICVVPELDDGYDGDYDLIRAARRVFLTLNKNARKVSDSRNRLLDDEDLISVFLRRVLGAIKDRQLPAGDALRIWGIELDQARDRVRVVDPVALTGVNHVYYIIESLMMLSGLHQGIRPQPGSFSQRQVLEVGLNRLDGRDLLGDEPASAIRRSRFSDSEAHVLTEAFFDRIRSGIVRMFDQFGPFRVHNEVVGAIQAELLMDQDRRLETLLFEGQGSIEVFRRHLDLVEERRRQVADDGPGAAPLDALLLKLRTLSARLDVVLEEIASKRARRCVESGLGVGAEIPEQLVRMFRDLYQYTFRTVAFQSAVVSTLFDELERFRLSDGSAIDPADTAEAYFSQISSFFLPTSAEGLRRLVRCMFGELTEAGSVPWTWAESTRDFRSVVFSGEMQPSQWPKTRYLLLELWRPDNGELETQVAGQLVICRREVALSLFRTRRAATAREAAIPEDSISDDQLTAVVDSVVSDVRSFVDNLDGRDLSETQVREWLSSPPEEDPDEEDGSAA